MSKPRALENHLLLLKDKKCVILTNLDKTSWQKTAKFGVSNENEEWHRKMILPSGLDSTAGQQWALVLYYIIGFQCVQKVFHLYKSLHFWREIYAFPIKILCTNLTNAFYKYSSFQSAHSLSCSIVGRQIGQDLPRSSAHYHYHSYQPAANLL